MLVIYEFFCTKNAFFLLFPLMDLFKNMSIPFLCLSVPSEEFITAGLGFQSLSAEITHVTHAYLTP